MQPVPKNIESHGSVRTSERPLWTWGPAQALTDNEPDEMEQEAAELLELQVCPRPPF